MKQICIICAIRQESSAILRRFPSSKLSVTADFPAWSFEAFGNNVILIQSGIGISKAAKAATTAAILAPEIILSVGFCGALSPAVATGEVFLAEKLYSYRSGEITGEIIPDNELAARIGAGLNKGTFITTAEIIEKAKVSLLLPEPAAINLLEMESAGIAAVCRNQSIKFAAIRAVSDILANDPCCLFRNICDNEFNISKTKLTIALARNPSLMPGLLILANNARIAGNSLAKAIESTLERLS